MFNDNFDVCDVCVDVVYKRVDVFIHVPFAVFLVSAVLPLNHPFLWTKLP